MGSDMAALLKFRSRLRGRPKGTDPAQNADVSQKIADLHRLPLGNARIWREEKRHININFLLWSGSG